MQKKVLRYLLFLICILMSELLYSQKLSFGLSGSLSLNHIHITSGLPAKSSQPGVGWQAALELNYQFHQRFSILLSSNVGLYHGKFTYPDRNDFSVFQRHQINSTEIGGRIGIGYVIQKNEKRTFEVLGSMGPRWILSMKAIKSGVELENPRPDAELYLGTLYYTLALQSILTYVSQNEVWVGVFFQNKLPFQLPGFENSGYLYLDTDTRMSFWTYGVYLKFRIHE